MKVIREDGLVVSENMKMATSFEDRLIGLMFKKPMTDYDSLMIDPCRSIHTFFMRYSLDILFISKKNEVVAIYRNIKPWRMSWIHITAQKALEIESGKLNPEIKVGDRLKYV